MIIYNAGENFKPKIFEYDSRRHHFPNDVNKIHQTIYQRLSDLLYFDVGAVNITMKGTNGIGLPHFVCPDNDTVILYTIQKFNKKRVDSGKMRMGDRGREVTKFIVAYPSHCIVRAYEFPAKLISNFYQAQNHFVVEMKTWNQLASELCSR